MSKLWCRVMAVALVLLFPLVIFSQQDKSNQKRPVPSLDSDDVVSDHSSPASSEVSSADGGEAAAEKDGKSTPKKEASPEETAWRASVKDARAHAEATEKAAEETELHATDLRNQLSAAGQDPQEHNRIVAEMQETGDKLKQDKADAQDAKDALDRLLDEGKEKGYSEETEGPSPVTKNGEANEDYYRQKYQELTHAADDAQRKVELYDNQVKDLNAQVIGNSHDNFRLSQLKEQASEAQQKLDQAHADLDKAQSDIEALKEEARRAGVPPGVFR